MTYLVLLQFGVWEEDGTGQSLTIGSGPDLQNLIPVATGRLAFIIHLPRCFMKSGRYYYMGVSKNSGTPKSSILI